MQRAAHPGAALFLVLLLVSACAATILLTQQDGNFGPAGGGDDLTVLILNLGGNSDGLALIDRTNETISIYQYQGRRGDIGGLVLLAVRSYRYDRQLEEYNSSQPPVSEVQELLKRAQWLDQEEGPAVSAPAKQ